MNKIDRTNASDYPSPNVSYTVPVGIKILESISKGKPPGSREL